ncbi:MAG: GTP cyclohydrolase I [Alphaproteobacteria bacterium]|jgi:GTP cyclohydrolase I
MSILNKNEDKEPKNFSNSDNNTFCNDMTSGHTASKSCGHSHVNNPKIVTRDEAENAITTLLAWAGDNPMRSGLLETPARVTKAFEEWFEGYAIDPAALLNKSFDEVAGYNSPVMLKNIPFHSHCEHHLAPIIGKAHIAYIPNGKVVGISKLARITEAFAKRLQIQERLTAQIANCIADTLDAKGVAVMIEAEHFCMTTRGVNTHGTDLVTYHLTGQYQDDPQFRQEFMNFCR